MKRKTKFIWYQYWTWNHFHKLIASISFVAFCIIILGLLLAIFV